MEALYVFLKNCHGISFANYHIKFFMQFDLTTFQGVSHGFILSDLVNYSISEQMKFDSMRKLQKYFSWESVH